MGVEGCVVYGGAGGGAGDHREERGGEEHAAEDLIEGDSADEREDQTEGEGGEPAGGGDGVPPGADWKGEHLPERGDLGDDFTGGEA